MSEAERFPEVRSRGRTIDAVAVRALLSILTATDTSLCERHS